MTEHTQQPQKKRSWGKTFLKACAFLIGLIGLINAIGSAGGNKVMAVELPKCDSETAIDMVKRAIANNVLKDQFNLQVVAVKKIKTLTPTTEELKANPEGFVKCQGQLITNYKRLDRIYTFEWTNKAKGEYYLELTSE